jgi:hypothetical protein
VQPKKKRLKKILAGRWWLTILAIQEEEIRRIAV